MAHSTQETIPDGTPGSQETRQEIRQEIKPDICVIGAGAGGLTAAAAAAAFGSNVVLIEKDRMGGESLYRGALPAQALIAVAERAHAVRSAARFGVKTVRFGVDFEGVRARLREVIAAVAPLHSRERFAGMGVRVIEGVGHFTDRETVAANGFVIKARRFIIATGSSPELPPIAGLAEVPHLTSENVFELEECPRHLIVVGAGTVAIEMAQAFRRLGAEVTVLSDQAPLAGYDREGVDLVIDGLVRDGVKLRCGVKVAQVRRALSRVQVDFSSVEFSSADIAGEVGTETQTETIEGSHIFVATGRQPNLAALDLDKAGIRNGANGIVVDRRLLTSNKQVYAIGDVVDAAKWTHVGQHHIFQHHAAQHHAGLVIRHALFRTPVDAGSSAVPGVTFTDPEMAQVGMTEDEARGRSYPFRILRWPYSENERAAAKGETNGHIKIVADRNGGVLGVTLVGACGCRKHRGLDARHQPKTEY